MNSSVARHLGSPLTATITFYSVALVTSILLFMIYGDVENLYNIKKVSLYLYLTGFVSAFIIVAITVLIPVLGARKLVILSISGQVLMAILIGHFGLLESPKDPITLQKLPGASLLVSGVLLSSNQ